MKKNKKRDIVKIKGIIGLIIFVSCLVTVKVLNIYYLHGENRMEIAGILAILMVVSLFMFSPYIQRLTTTGK